MRSQVCASLAAWLFVATTVVSAQAPDPFLGTWKLDPARSSHTPGPGPQSATVTLSPAGAGFKGVVDGVNGKGEKIHFEFTASYDGRDYPMTGNPDGDTVAVKRVGASIVETTFKKAGKTTLVNKRTLSSDGRTVTVTTTGTNAHGQTVNNTQVFEKG